MSNAVQPSRIDILEEQEDQIEAQRREIDYNTREFTIELIVSKYLEKDDDDLSEIYVPEYQREFVWDITRQSRFIESIILGLPIPQIFVAEISETGRLEIVDGSQRIRTLAAFLTNQLQLNNLKKLASLNGLYFKELAPSRQRKLKNTFLRTVVLSDKADERVKNDMFDRINTSSLDLTPMETRRGLHRGKFIDFVFECAKNDIFLQLCPISKYFQNRYEEAELALRFFALAETYPNFYISQSENKPDLDRTGLARFLDEYVIWKNQSFSHEEQERKLRDFERMLNFVRNTFPSGFKKYQDSDATYRPYFESISVGSHLALQAKSDLVVKSLWPDSETNNQTSNFLIPIGRYHTHKPEKIRQRIDYVKDKLIGYSL